MSDLQTAGTTQPKPIARRCDDPGDEDFPPATPPSSPFVRDSPLLGGKPGATSSRGAGVGSMALAAMMGPGDAELPPSRTDSCAGELSAAENSLELEAIAAVHELSFAVEAISVSEMLPRTAELIFVNVTTLEGRPFCLELTQKGWRVSSFKQDCMNGDYRQLALHTRYFESPYSLMDQISPMYRDRFGERLAARLKLIELEMDQGDGPGGECPGGGMTLPVGVANGGCMAPASSYAGLGHAFPQRHAHQRGCDDEDSSSSPPMSP